MSWKPISLQPTTFNKFNLSSSFPTWHVTPWTFSIFKSLRPCTALSTFACFLLLMTTDAPSKASRLAIAYPILQQQNDEKEKPWQQSQVQHVYTFRKVISILYLSNLKMLKHCLNISKSDDPYIIDILSYPQMFCSDVEKIQMIQFFFSWYKKIYIERLVAVSETCAISLAYTVQYVATFGDNFDELSILYKWIFNNLSRDWQFCYLLNIIIISWKVLDLT